MAEDAEGFNSSGSGGVPSSPQIVITFRQEHGTEFRIECPGVDAMQMLVAAEALKLQARKILEGAMRSGGQPAPALSVSKGGLIVPQVRVK